MSLTNDLKVIYRLAVAPVRGNSHQERLESFYGGQAKEYDSFRERLLKGRRELCAEIDFPPGGTWVDLGGGTGKNLEFLEPSRLAALDRVTVVDLAPSLLDMARERIQQHGWSNVETVAADATTWLPDSGAGSIDVVTFSYSLTMIPDWFAAIDHALTLLKPGGLVGVVDFYVARKYPAEARRKHGWWTRSFWRSWFGFDNVFLDPNHLPYLERRFETVSVAEERARVPYVPLGRVPYYRFVGRKRA